MSQGFIKPLDMQPNFSGEIRFYYLFENKACQLEFCMMLFITLELSENHNRLQTCRRTCNCPGVRENVVVYVLHFTWWWDKVKIPKARSCPQFYALFIAFKTQPQNVDAAPSTRQCLTSDNKGNNDHNLFSWHTTIFTGLGYPPHFCHNIRQFIDG